MIGDFPGGHLVVGYMPMEANAIRPSLMVRRLISRLAPHDDWSTSTRQEAYGPALYCFFKSKQDADRLARAVKARAMSRYPGWASQRWFDLDGAMLSSIVSDLTQRDV